jgi:hypothetical protein
MRFCHENDVLIFRHFTSRQLKLNLKYRNVKCYLSMMRLSVSSRQQPGVTPVLPLKKKQLHQLK